jgi:hypothetical protein
MTLAEAVDDLILRRVRAGRMESTPAASLLCWVADVCRGALLRYRDRAIRRPGVPS